MSDRQDIWRKKLKRIEGELTAAAGLDEMSMDQQTRNHITFALDKCQDILEDMENGK